MTAKNSGQFILVLILKVCSATWSTTSSPYYQRFNDGSYNYGYNAGGGFSARQSGTASNEVSGQYAQLLPDGNLVNVRYKAGVGGFRPQLGSSLSTTARPYGFAYNTGDAFHQAAADQNGNVRGNYWYRDSAGARHDLRYRAGPGIEFVPTGGGLAIPNGLGRRSPGYGLTTPRWNGPDTFSDGPYGFSYGDPGTVGNINPNGVNSRSPVPSSSSIGGPAAGDGSYNFGYRTPDAARQEGSDGRGNVHGSYSFRNGGGNHDLAFVAGPGIGFQPTGGTLARPNGLGHGGSYGNVNDGGRIGGNRPSLGSTSGSNGGLGHGHEVGHVHPAYNAGGTRNIGLAGANSGSRSSGFETGGHDGTGGHLGTIGDTVTGAGSTNGVGSVGTNIGGGGGSGIGGEQGGRTGGLEPQGGVTSGDSGLRSTGGKEHEIGTIGSTGGGIGHGPNSAGTNAGGSSGIGGHGRVGGLGSTGGGLSGHRGDGSRGSGLGGYFGNHRPGLANSNAVGGFGGYGAGGQGYGDGRGHGGFTSGSGSTGGHYSSGASSGLTARRELINNDGGNIGHLGTALGTGGGFGSGSGISGAGSTGNGGYTYGTSGGGSAGSSFGRGSGGSAGSSFGSGGSSSAGSSFGSGGGGASGDGHSAGLSVQSLQTSGSGQNSGSGGSSSSIGGEVSGEQQDLQRSVDSVQSLQSVGGSSSSTKGISTR